MNITLVQDNEVLWMAVTKVGSPPAWQQGTRYNLGDIIIPTAVQPGQENLAFQCVGFLGKSASSQPVFPTSPGTKVIDGEIEWTTQTVGDDPLPLPYNQYFQIINTLTTS